MKKDKVKTALITGAFGQDGYFLTERLLALGSYRVICTSNSLSKNSRPFSSHEAIVYESLDIKNDFEVFNIVKKYKPDELYHLASFSAPIVSWDDPREVIDINGSSTLCFLDAIMLYSPQTKFFFASSAKIFGKPKETPQNENSFIDPLDPYSLGKYIGNQSVKLYRNRFNIFACNGVLYNHESHLKNVNFVCYKICHFANKLKKGEISSFSLLDSTATIDLGDPRDYVEAMRLIIQQDKAEDYIISMNKSISIREICLQVGNLLEIKDIMSYINFEHKSQRISASGPRGDNEKLKSIGWVPRFNTRDTLSLILQDGLSQKTSP